MHVRKVLSLAVGAAAFAVATQAWATPGLDAANHSQWDEGAYNNGFGGAAPVGSVEYSVGFGTIADFDGRVLSNAGITTNTVDSSPLTTISTGLFTGTDANLYQIKITNPASFSASIPSTSLILALFGADGKGKAASIGGAADALTGANSGVTVPGIYYIGIADVGLNPENAAGQNIFGLSGTAGVFTPVTADTVLSSDPTTAWTQSTGAGLLQNVSFGASGSTITLAGTGFAVTTPEPASMSLVGVGAMALIARRRRSVR